MQTLELRSVSGRFGFESEGIVMADQSKLQEKLKELRHLVRAGRERLATHSPVWAVYLTGETFRSMADVLDEMEKEMAPSADGEWDQRIRKTG
jgi:hypothetical protein